MTPSLLDVPRRPSPDRYLYVRSQNQVAFIRQLKRSFAEHDAVAQNSFPCCFATH